MEYILSNLIEKPNILLWKIFKKARNTFNCVLLLFLYLSIIQRFNLIFKF